MIVRRAGLIVAVLVGWCALAHAQPGPAAGGTPPLVPPPAPPPAPGGSVLPAPAIAPPDAAPLAEPPAQWTRWEVTGMLIDPPARVRALLEADMRTHRAITLDARRELGEVCERLGYHMVDLVVSRPGDGEVVATLVLAPNLMVRWVEIDLEQSAFNSIVDDDIRRRMRLRPGGYLPWDRPSRIKRLTEEAERIKGYLRDDGFFEARVNVALTRVGRSGARITVRGSLGPGYRVGKVKVVNAAQGGGDLALSTAEIASTFHASFWCRVRGTCRFSRTRFQAGLDGITRRFQRRGYPAARVSTDFDPLTSFDRASKRVTFTVTVDPRRKIDVVFEGNDKDAFSDELLTAQLTFGAATSADDIEVAASARAIERLYQARGYLDVIVTGERVRLRAFDRVVYRIEGGPARRVRAVDFVCRGPDGAVAACGIPISDLRGAVGTRTDFTFYESRTYPTREQLAADVAGLERLYRRRGFLAARVRLAMAPRRTGWASMALAAAEVAAEVAPRDVYVRFEIDEGPRTVIDRIEIVFEGGAAGGRFAGDEDRIRARLGVHPGDPYLRDQLDEQAQALKDWYWSLGRPRAVVTVGPPVALADDQHVAVTFTIEEKQELHLGEVVVRGNFRTREWVIRDQLAFVRGALLTADLQTGGLRRLRATNLFNGVAFDLLRFEDSRDTTVDVVVKVDERYDYAGAVDLEAGWSLDNGPFLRPKLTAPNVAGLGIKVDAGVTLGSQYQAGEASVRLPRWLIADLSGLRFDVEVAAFARNQVTERFGDLASVGGSVAALRTWERPRDAHHGARLVSAALRYDVRQLNRDEDAIRPAGLAESDPQNPIKTRTGTIGLTLALDQRRDAGGNLNPLAPTAGFRIEGGVALASTFVFGQDNFVKLSGLGQAFHTRGRLQLRAEGRYDQGIPIDGALLPEVERFFAGGDDTVRGFDEDRLATELIVAPVPPLDSGCDPVDPTAGGLCQVRILPAGGNIRAIGTLDGQVSLVRLGGVPFASALFTDAGIITNTWGSARLSSIRPSAGMAVRALLPIGAVSLEYAVPLLTRLGDNPRGRLHLAVALRY